MKQRWFKAYSLWIYGAILIMASVSGVAVDGAAAEDEEVESPRASRKRMRTAPITPQDLAIYFINRFHQERRQVYKTPIHKLIYLANGLSIALAGEAIIPGLSFEAHQYGPIVPEIQSRFAALEREASGRAVTFADHPEVVNILEVIFSIFKHYTATKLSEMTHEADTPWSITRREALHYGDMCLPFEKDREYFSNPRKISRLFFQPYVLGRINQDGRNAFVLRALLAKDPMLFSEYLSQTLSEVRQHIKAKNMVALKDVIEAFLINHAAIQDHDLLLRQHLGDIFVYRQQKITEGAAAEVIFEHDFIGHNEMSLLFDETFRVQAAVAAGLGSIPALYYLTRIFEVFSEEEGGEEASAAVTSQPLTRRIEERFQKVLEDMLRDPIPEEPTWRDVYARVLALFYKEAEDHSELMGSINKALDMRLPQRYRKDLLKRAIYRTEAPLYIDQGLAAGFQEFHMYQAIVAPSIEGAFPYFTETIIHSPEHGNAFFEAGKSILRHGYKVPADSRLWERMGCASPSAEDTEELVQEKNRTLGEALLRKAIELNVQEALVLWIDLYEAENPDKALSACEFGGGGKPWQYYQKGKIKERQHALEEAIAAYTRAGPLLGYLDAARLSASEEETRLLKEREDYKKTMLENLFEDFSREYLEEEI
ncbi:MAG: Panacea domain-containing protein [Alphaproteobacteria bacterium]|nr:Panacea domain-containing protein [Alphaproteobacteria bacterium]